MDKRKPSWTGWAVVVGMAGCYLANNIRYTRYKLDARSIAIDEKAAYIDAGYTVRGDIARDGHYRVYREGCNAPWILIEIEQAALDYDTAEFLASVGELDKEE